MISGCCQGLRDSRIDRCDSKPKPDHSDNTSLDVVGRARGRMQSLSGGLRNDLERLCSSPTPFACVSDAHLLSEPPHGKQLLFRRPIRELQCFSSSFHPLDVLPRAMSAEARMRARNIKKMNKKYTKKFERNRKKT